MHFNVSQQSSDGFLSDCWEWNHNVLIPREYRSSCVPCPPPPPARACRCVADHILLPGFSIPESNVDHLSQFASVLSVLSVHYLDVVPVKGVTSLEVVLRSFILMLKRFFQSLLHTCLHNPHISLRRLLLLLDVSLGATSSCLSVYPGFECKAMSCL